MIEVSIFLKVEASNGVCSEEENEMKALEADNLKQGDPVMTFNGQYTQQGEVRRVSRDHRGVRWVHYRWTRPSGEIGFGCKRHVSVYLLCEGESDGSS